MAAKQSKNIQTWYFPNELWSTRALVSIRVRAIEILPFDRVVPDDFP
jgi:hypothetical protein